MSALTQIPAAATPTQPIPGEVFATYTGDTVIAAGSMIHFEVSIVSPVALPRGTEIGLARRWPSDWGTAQSADPSGPDFLRIDCASGGAVRWWNARSHPWHPFDHVLFVTLPDGLPANETLRARFGGDAGVSPGFTAQTFIEEASPLSIRIREQMEDAWREIARPTIRITGAEPHRLVLTVPSRVQVGLPMTMHLRVEDRWGNPSQLGGNGDSDPIRIDGLDASMHVGASGWARVELTLQANGVHRIRARSKHFTAISNPIDVVDEPVKTFIYWGDIHAQSVIGCGARSIDAYFHHARDFAATDFGSHQANCFLVSNDEWTETATSTSRIHGEGRFVTLLGVEWSAQSAYGGDHNLYFPGERAALHRCSHEFVVDKSDIGTDIRHVDELHEHYRGSDTLIAVHVGGRTADLRWHDPSLDRLIEVHSTHATSEWFLFDALKRGYRMGVISGSDGVDGRPGASHPGHMGVRNVRGGLTAVAMPQLSRGALWSALKARRCYGTTGARILLELRAGEATMGDEITVSSLPPFDVRVEGTAPIERVDFFRDDVMIDSIDMMSGNAETASANASAATAATAAAAGTASNAVRVAWCGTTAPGNWQRARMLWEGLIRVDGASIIDVQEWALDTPDEGIRESDSHTVRFRTITAGDWDGVILTLDSIATAEITFVTEPMTLHARLGDLHGSEPRTFEADNPARRLELRRLPSKMPAPGWNGRFIDASAPHGDHAYWIRVRQSDGEYAWSTPIFVSLT